jgi:hypothetical protein
VIGTVVPPIRDGGTSDSKVREHDAAKPGLSFAFATPSVTAIWPPTGLALAALVLGGYRLWPGVAIGALLASSWTGFRWWRRSELDGRT